MVLEDNAGHYFARWHVVHSTAARFKLLSFVRNLSFLILCLSLSVSAIIVRIKSNVYPLPSTELSLIHLNNAVDSAVSITFE
jgi:hypothetical protein